jgi:ArsR family transcriptional regulator
MTSATSPQLASAAPDDSTDEQALADLCKAGADVLRLRVLRLLHRDAMDVSELCELLDVRQPALSHHLKLMSRAGLLSSQRDGNHIFYRRCELLADDPRSQLQQALFAAADALPLSGRLADRLQALQARRAANSLEFFRNNTARFHEQQDLIAGPERYAAAVRAKLEKLPAGPRHLALEIGPGEGWLLPVLADRYQRVVALDNSPQMLERSRRHIEDAQLGNVELQLGDTTHGVLRDAAADLVVVNMVLHHTPDPALTLREAAAALRPGGALLLTELCEHGQGWAREHCGDLWLGFTPELLLHWAQEAGLDELASDYLAQRNGFKLQVRLFGAPLPAR